MKQVEKKIFQILPYYSSIRRVNVRAKMRMVVAAAALVVTIYALTATTATLYFSNPRGGNERTAVAVRGLERLQHVGALLEDFHKRKGRLPDSLDELAFAYPAEGIESRKRMFPRMSFRYLGDRGKTSGVIAYCLYDDWDADSLGYIDYEFKVYQDSYRPWVLNFQKSVDKIPWSE